MPDDLNKPLAPTDPDSFPRDYVRELREENRGWRLKAEEQGQAARRAREEAAQHREEAARARAQADTVVADARRTADDRVIRAELRAAATRAGMVDLDGLKLADLSAVTLDEDGAVQGVDTLLTALAAAKPYLFGAGGRLSSSNPAAAPAPLRGGPRDARALSREEYERELKKLTRR